MITYDNLNKTKSQNADVNRNYNDMQTAETVASSASSLEFRSLRQ